MIKIRRAEDRGHFDFGWLDTYHSFSFGQYLDPSHINFRVLRVINEDRIKPRGEFPNHPHRDMEIITYVIDGELTHGDSMGNKGAIRAGDVQRMSAGSGVVHSEANKTKTTETHILQIWIFPDEKGIAPEYEQKHFSREDKLNRLCPIAARRVVEDKKKSEKAEEVENEDGSLNLHQDAVVYASILEPSRALDYVIAEKRYIWLQIISGVISVNAFDLNPGDGMAVSEEATLTIMAREESEFLLFDLP